MSTTQTSDGNGRAAHIDSLLKGAVDLHVHSGPSVMPRSLDHFEAVRDATAVGMRAIGFKDHWYTTVPVIDLIKAHVPEARTQVLSGIVLNNSSGGLNPHAVDHALKFGGRIVWMPTVAAANHARHRYRKKSHVTRRPLMPAVQISVLDERNKLVDAAKQVLDLIAEHDAILAAGHLHVSEIFILFDEAKKRGVNRRMINHPFHIVETTIDDVRELAQGGTYMEFCVNGFIDCRNRRHTPQQLKEFIDAAGIEQSFFGSDLGQDYNPRPVAGYREMINMCIDLGYSDEQIRQLFGTNAARCAGLETNAA